MGDKIRVFLSGAISAYIAVSFEIFVFAFLLFFAFEWFFEYIKFNERVGKYVLNKIEKIKCLKK